LSVQNGHRLPRCMILEVFREVAILAGATDRFGKFRSLDGAQMVQLLFFLFPGTGSDPQLVLLHRISSCLELPLGSAFLGVDAKKECEHSQARAFALPIRYHTDATASREKTPCRTISAFNRRQDREGVFHPLRAASPDRNHPAAL